MNRSRIFITAVVFAVTSIFSVSAFADTPSGVKVKVIEFEDDMIPGDVMTPDIAGTRVKEEDDLVNLVRARTEFTDQMLRAVEDL